MNHCLILVAEILDSKSFGSNEQPPLTSSKLWAGMLGSLEECKYRTMVWKDWKSQTIFHSSSEEGHENVKKSNGFWRMKKQSSKDAVLNELERQDAALDRPAFKHVFRHGGLFDDEYADDPEGEGADARDWLRGIEDDMLPSYSDSMDSDVDDGTLDMDIVDTDLLVTPSLVEL